MSSFHLLKFKINNYIYAIELKYLIEVGKISDFFKIPSPVNYFEGLFNLRGNIIPVINIGKRLGIDYEINCFNEKNFIFINDTVYSFIIVVDKILGVKEYSCNIANQNKDLIIDTIIDNNEIISMIDVKQIIVLKDFKLSKKFIFKSIQSIEELESVKEKDQRIKIPFIIFQINNIFFAIETKFVKQLINATTEYFKLFSINELVSGELEFEKKIIEVINFAKFLRLNYKSNKISDYYIAVIENNKNLSALLLPENTEFVEIYEDNIYEEISFFQDRDFIDKVFKFNDVNVKVINFEKLFNCLAK